MQKKNTSRSSKMDAQQVIHSFIWCWVPSHGITDNDYVADNDHADDVIIYTTAHTVSRSVGRRVCTMQSAIADLFVCILCRSMRV